MSIDGYTEHLLSTNKFNNVYKNQSKINARLTELAREVTELPPLPKSIEMWINSITDPTSNFITLKDYSKHLKIKKEYNDLIEISDNNLREMKILAIEDILDKINIILKSSD